MIDNFHAHFWGLKAAQSGLLAKDNPYTNPGNRAAWNAGFRMGTQRKSAG